MSLTLPDDGPIVLNNSHIPACVLRDVPGLESAHREGLVRIDLMIHDGLISGVAMHDPEGLDDGIDLDGRMIWPAPIDIHTHLDKGHIWPRQPNPDGTFEGALQAVDADRLAHWSPDDVRARMEFALRCAYAHGTCALRTHLDSYPPAAAHAWEVFADVRAAWSDRMTLQAVSLKRNDHIVGAVGERLADMVAAHGGLLGLVPTMADDLDAVLDRYFALAAERGLDCDLHVDETDDPSARTLEAIARAVLRNRFEGRVVCGHCCSLACQPPAYQREVIALLKEAGIAVVSLTMCNLYLQHRRYRADGLGCTPHWRGITRLHELRAAGVPVMVASDNTRDPFYAYGDLDLLEVFRESTRIAHFDHPFDDWLHTITTTPAEIMGLAERGVIGTGAPADLIVFEGRSFNEVLARPEANRTVIRHGRAIDRTLPDYRELDHLFA